MKTPKHNIITKTIQTERLLLGLVFALSVSISACGGENDFVAPPTANVPPPAPPVTPPTPPTGSENPEDSQGDAFAAAFKQEPFSEPIDPKSGDIIALNITADPIAILPDP